MMTLTLNIATRSSLLVTSMSPSAVTSGCLRLDTARDCEQCSEMWTGQGTPHLQVAEGYVKSGCPCSGCWLYTRKWVLEDGCSSTRAWFLSYLCGTGGVQNWSCAGGSLEEEE